MQLKSKEQIGRASQAELRGYLGRLKAQGKIRFRSEKHANEFAQFVNGQRGGGCQSCAR